MIFNDQLKTITPSKGIRDHHFDPAAYKYHFTEGNVKMGRILSWQTLMSDYTVNGLSGLLENSRGTCGNCSGCVHDCYVRASYRFPSVIFQHAANAWGLRNDIDKVRNDLAEQLSRSPIDVVRINQSGEVENDEQFAMWCQLAAAFPKKHFYIYTKMYDIAIRALKAGSVPDNFVVNFSVWHSFGVSEFNSVKHFKNVKAFVYDDGADMMLSPKIYCAAYDESGHLDHDHSCIGCKLCFNSSAKVIGCHAH